ncbi:MAG: prolipoprotein diacylglyceryl transferase [Saprospiraceae bacterium]
MYPDLSYLFHALIGTSVDNWLSMFKTFGFFLALAFLASAFVFYIELKRKAAEGFFRPKITHIVEGAPPKWSEVALNAFIGMVLLGKGLYAYQDFAAFRRDPASVILSGKMHWLGALAGAAIFGALTWWDARRKQKEKPVARRFELYPHHQVSEITVWAAVGGILGAKFFEVFDNWQEFLNDPAGMLLSGGGLAFFGGLILGAAAVIYYLRRNGIPFLPAADACAPALVTGYGVGRLGCQFSGDGDWGIVNNAPKPGWLPEWLWASRYPHHVLNTPHTDPVPSVPVEGCTWDYCMQLSEPVYPTPLYETLMMALIFGILWTLRKQLKTPGLLFFIYLALIAVERFFIEKIRVNVTHDVAGVQLTQAEIISILLFVIAAAGMWLTVRMRRAQTLSEL